MKNNYKFILFDLDDTLIDNYQNIKFAFEKVLEFRGEPKSFETIFDKWYDFDEQFWLDFINKKIVVPKEYATPNEKFVAYVRGLRFVRFFGDITIEQGMEYNNIYLSNLGQMVVEIDGAKNLLENLSTKYTLVVATNGPSEAVNVKLEKIGCSEFISYIFAADQTKSVATKPDKAYFEELKEYLNEPDNSKYLYVGDSLDKDILGAYNIGFDSVWLNRAGKDCPKEYKPTYIIRNLSELLSLLN